MTADTDPPSWDQIFGEPHLPSPEAGDLYSSLWQIEVWLRTLAYTELRFARKRWENLVRKPFGRQWPPRSQSADESMTHMSSPNPGPLDYLTFGQLKSLLLHDDLIQYFQPYLPPKDIFAPRFQEVAQVRHRVAHFRRPHKRDLERVTLFMKDLEPGLWKFCTSYNDETMLLPSHGDPVFDALYQCRRFDAMEFQGTLRSPHRHADDGRWIMGIFLKAGVRAWSSARLPKAAGKKGAFYRIGFYDIHGRLDVRDFFEATSHLHGDMVHFVPEGGMASRAEVTLSGMLGKDRLREVVLDLTDRAWSSVRSKAYDDRFSHRNPIPDPPHFVLPPNHALALLDSSMKCDIFTYPE